MSFPPRHPMMRGMMMPQFGPYPPMGEHPKHINKPVFNKFYIHSIIFYTYIELI